MPNGSRVAVGVAALALCVILIGCGGGGGDEAGTTAAGTTAGATGTATSPDLAAKAKRLIPIASQSQAVASKKESLRIADAQSELLLIAQQDPEAIAPLTAALEKPDYELITDIYNFYIQLGQPGSERVLVEALNRQPYAPEGSTIALAYYASGNKRLVRGAREWASDHGATISGQPGGIGPRWGQTGLPTPEIPTAPPPSP